MRTNDYSDYKGLNDSIDFSDYSDYKAHIGFFSSFGKVRRPKKTGL